MKVFLIGGAGVADDEDIIVAMKGVAHCAVDTAIGREPNHHQRVDVTAA